MTNDFCLSLKLQPAYIFSISTDTDTNQCDKKIEQKKNFFMVGM